MTDSQVSIGPGTMYGTLSKDGKGWFDFFCPRRGKTKNLSDNRLGPKKVLDIEIETY